MPQGVIACEDYLFSRTGRYEWRSVRYRAVAQLLVDHGLTHEHIVVDIGAGWTEFDYFLRTEHAWRGRYYPLDGMFDGVDLETWQPRRSFDFAVAIELIEHLHDPRRMLDTMSTHANLSVITTPNPATVDVLGMDADHRTPVSIEELARWGWHAMPATFYGTPNDSILAWRAS